MKDTEKFTKVRYPPFGYSVFCPKPLKISFNPFYFKKH